MQFDLSVSIYICLTPTKNLLDQGVSVYKLHISLAGLKGLL